MTGCQATNWRMYLSKLHFHSCAQSSRCTFLYLVVLFRHLTGSIELFRLYCLRCLTHANSLSLKIWEFFQEINVSSERKSFNTSAWTPGFFLSVDFMWNSLGITKKCYQKIVIKICNISWGNTKNPFPDSSRNFTNKLLSRIRQVSWEYFTKISTSKSRRIAPEIP